MKDLVAGVERFQSKIYPSHRELFEHLAHGQSPEVLFVSCADSRVDPSLLTQSPPGKLFVMRNAGNLVPDYTGEPSGEAATIAYAIDHLAVHHIVVCGHSGCGAVTAVLEGHQGDVIADWLEHAGPLEAEIAQQWPSLTGNDRLNAAVYLNTFRQLDNLMTHPSVSRALERGELELHAWVYDIASGHVTAYDPVTNAFVDLADAHKEDALVAELDAPIHEVEEGWIDHGPWTVVFIKSGPDRRAVRAALAQITGWDDRRVRRFIDHSPGELMAGVTQMEAEVVRTWLEEAGATIELQERSF